MIFFDLLYIIILLVTVPLWGINIFFKKTYREIFWHRLVPAIPKPSANKKRLWLHAVSVGEVRSIKKLVSELKEECIKNNMEIVLSVTTPSGYEFAKEQYPDIYVINAPLDLSFTIRLFIKRINPALLVLNELEIWPNWVTIINKKQVPILLINGRISQHAFKQYQRFNFFFKQFFAKIDRFLIQAELYKERFMQLGIDEEKIEVCGNIKADEAFNSLKSLPPREEIQSLLNLAPNGRQIVVVASSHADDEQMVVPAIQQLAERFLFIIVPRHLDRLNAMEKHLTELNVPYTVWSKVNGNDEKKSKDKIDKTLIFDQMGYLFHILKIADIVFMGGTLDSKVGGHNLYEPAVLGKFIMGGSHYNNFPAIGAELADQGVYRTVSSTQECIHLLNRCGTGGLDWETLGGKGLEVVSHKRGSLQCILKEIQRYIA